jgi:hypothetical protein
MDAGHYVYTATPPSPQGYVSLSISKLADQPGQGALARRANATACGQVRTRRTGMTEGNTERMLSVAEIKALTTGELASLAKVTADWGPAGERVLTMARDWWLRHRATIMAADPRYTAKLIGEADALETNGKSRYNDGKYSRAGVQYRLRDSEAIVATALPGALPFESHTLWDAFVEMQLWYWDGMPDHKRVSSWWSDLTEKVAQKACGAVAIALINQLRVRDSGEVVPVDDDGDPILPPPAAPGG